MSRSTFSTRLFILLSLFIANLVGGLCHAQQPGRRIALVVGIGAYQHLSVLANPVSDARLMAKSLREVGFDTTLVTDTSRASLVTAARSFASQIGPSDVGVFFYAGHAVQVSGRNYLLPVEAVFPRQANLERVAFNAEELISSLASRRNAANIIILDACRDSPYPEISRSIAQHSDLVTTPGLAQMDAPKGTLIAFSTAPGKVALDGRGANSIYTAALADQIRVPGLPVEEIFKRVRAKVTRETDDRQIPWENTSLIGNLTFLPNSIPKTGFEPSLAPTESTKSVDVQRALITSQRNVNGISSNWDNDYLSTLWNQRGKPSAGEWNAMAKEISIEASLVRQDDLLPLIRAAEHGNSKSQTVLAEVYRLNGAIRSDQVKSVQWLIQAANNNFAIAQHKLGLCYLNGEGVTADTMRGRALLQESAAMGYAPALADLGRSFLYQSSSAEERATGNRYLVQATLALKALPK